MMFVCRFYVCFILAQVVQCGFCSEHRFCDADRINLGYATEHARYAGRLYEVYKYPYRSSETLSPVGSAAYYKDGFCLTTAHCVDERWRFGWLRYFDPDSYFKIGYRASFEIKDGQHTFFNVCARKMHEHYRIRGDYHDIALLKLDRSIEAFQDAKNTYDFTRLESFPYIKETRVEAKDVLTYIGYGYGGEDTDYSVKFDGYRRGSQSRLFNIVNNEFILSMPYQSDFVVLSESKYCLEPRISFQNESVILEDMSGGITLMNGRIIGLNRGVNYYYLSNYDYFSFIFLYCIGWLFDAINPKIFLPLRGAHVFKGLMAMSIMLSPYERWIEESCVENWRASPKWVNESSWKNSGDDMV